MYNTQQEISKKIDPTGPTSTMSFIQTWMSKRNGHIILRYIIYWVFGSHQCKKKSTATHTDYITMVFQGQLIPTYAVPA